MNWIFSIPEGYILKMADWLTPEQRSRNMAAIRSKNTRPEMIVRRLVFSMGYRYRLHVSTLPGKPDLVFPRSRKIIEVRGCFWHRHKCKEGQRIPGSNQEYWISKIDRNVARDRKNAKALAKEQWSVLVIWACEIRSLKNLQERLAKFLEK